MQSENLALFLILVKIVLLITVGNAYIQNMAFVEHRSVTVLFLIHKKVMRNSPEEQIPNPFRKTKFF